MQRLLKRLVEEQALASTGQGRWVRYNLPLPLSSQIKHEKSPSPIIPISVKAIAAQKTIRQSLLKRTPTGYDRTFLDSYNPNHSHYLSISERHHPASIGEPGMMVSDAGTYAKKIFNRLMIDFSWNSSRRPRCIGTIRRMISNKQRTKTVAKADRKLLC